MIEKYIKKEIQKSIFIKNKILEDIDLLNSIERASKVCIECLENDKKIILAGNGGSAADAQHIAGELVSKFYFDRPGLNAIALTTDTSIITAIGNDYGYEKLFQRQIQANGKLDDVFIGISTSGNSKNIILALEECKRKGIKTIGLTGEKESKMIELCDITIKIPSSSTPNIQESHIMVGHIICAIIEEQIFGKGFEWKQ
ncbi:D-sedoheptulose-7-phosphate isomerase [Aliarcobacter sp. ERUVET-7]|uniref:D-sedoheptulose-7-phosphate isomerase n=1 Tax=Aliarcobacter sp. ERUVET-7 TaxID=3429683 RepID=UPI003D6C0970